MKFSEYFKYKWATFTNLTFIISAILHAWYGNVFTTVGLLFIAITSFMYHYYTSIHHTLLEFGKENKKIFRKMKWWQRLDISSIYLVFGVYPYTIAGDPGWLFYLIPMFFLILNKLNVMLSTWKPDTIISIPISAIPMIILGFMHLPLINMILGISIFVVAIMIQFDAEEKKEEKDFKEYDSKHGYWHNITAIAFMLIR